jgi:hypothetical protein
LGQHALYDEDILQWSEEQASLIRRLALTRRDLPNELDVENVAEEIESVGRSELASVASLAQNIFLHAIKIAAEPDGAVSAHWRSEIVAFQADLHRRYSPSMRQRIDVPALWETARRQAHLILPDRLAANVDRLKRSPFDLDDLLVSEIDPDDLVRRIRTAWDEGEGAS